MRGFQLAPDTEPRRTVRSSTQAGRELFYESFLRGGGVEANRKEVNNLAEEGFRITQDDARRIARQVRTFRLVGTETPLNSPVIKEIITNRQAGNVRVQINGVAFGDVRFGVDASVRINPDDADNQRQLRRKIIDTATGIIADEVAQQIGSDDASDYMEFRDRLQEGLGQEMRIVFVN